MQSVRPPSCSCWILRQPLVGDELPDHVCEETLIATIYDGPRIAGAEIPVEVIWPVPFRNDDLWTSGPRQLGLVIREWAQEKPSRTFARLLQDSPEWEATARSIHGDYVRWRRDHVDAPLAEWIDDRSHERRHQEMLWQRRIPGTPATVRYLRLWTAYRAFPGPTSLGRKLVQVANDGTLEAVTLPRPEDEHARLSEAIKGIQQDHPDVLPARGLLVTTLVFARSGPIEEFGFWYDPDPIMRIEGPAEFATYDVLRAASDVTLKHRNWLRTKWGRHPLATPQAIHRAKVEGALTSHDLDFVEVATSDVLLAIEKHSPWATLSDAFRADFIDKELTKVYNRVRQRRSRKGLPTNVPVDWRKEAVRRILDLVQID